MFADKFASSIETMSNRSILLVVFSVVASLTGLYGFMIGTLAIGFIATAKQLLNWGIFPWDRNIFFFFLLVTFF